MRTNALNGFVMGLALLCFTKVSATSLSNEPEHQIAAVKRSYDSVRNISDTRVQTASVAQVAKAPTRIDKEVQLAAIKQRYLAITK